jgi:hypothetical protein
VLPHVHQWLAGDVLSIEIGKPVACERVPLRHSGPFFPTYTNSGCIGLIFSVISSLIMIFNIITFGLLWIAYRYNMLYVNKSLFDHRRSLFSKAVNQLFADRVFHVMELVLASHPSSLKQHPDAKMQYSAIILTLTALVSASPAIDPDTIISLSPAQVSISHSSTRVFVKKSQF